MVGKNVTENNTVENIESLFKDATAAAQTPELGDGYASAMTNSGFMANAVWTTEEAVEALSRLRIGLSIAVTTYRKGGKHVCDSGCALRAGGALHPGS
jgi:hypothetical protein